MLQDNELIAIDALQKKLNRVKNKNNNKKKYYNQKNKVKDLGINTPADLQGFTVVLGWATKAVDVLAERIKWKGFYNPEVADASLDETTSWLNNLYNDNNFEAEQRKAIKNALTTGIGFMSASRGDVEAGDPEVVWISEESNTITIDYDLRSRKIKAAFKVISDAVTHKPAYGILWLPDVTIQLQRVKNKWIEIERDEHNSGVVPVVPIFNNSDSENPYGRSEITPAVMDLSDSAMRRLVNVEVNSEYYAKPYRWAINLSDDDLNGMRENGASIIDTTAGDIVVIPTNLEHPERQADIKELGANDPSNVMNLIEPLARLVAREIGVPPSYMGFDSVNPSSVDAINAADDAIIKRADDRIVELRRTYKSLANISMIVAGKSKPDNWNAIDTIFEKTETMTPSASADRFSKLAAVGFYTQLYPEFVYRGMGMSDAEIVELKAHLRNVTNTQIIGQLSEPITTVVDNSGAVVEGE